MSRKKHMPEREPRTYEEIFEAYTRATYEEIARRRELDAWQHEHPNGDPGGLLAVWGSAKARREALAQKLDELNAQRTSPGQ